MYFVYAGFSNHLNRRSLDRFNQIFLVKFGYCKTLDGWEDRFNNGYKPEDSEIRTSLPLALHRDWERIATVEVGERIKAHSGIEQPLLDWAQRFGTSKLLPFVNNKVRTLHLRRLPHCPPNPNGLSEIRRIDWKAVPRLSTMFAEAGLNDPLADEIVREVGCFLERELSAFVSSLYLKLRRKAA